MRQRQKQSTRFHRCPSDVPSAWTIAVAAGVVATGAVDESAAVAAVAGGGVPFASGAVCAVTPGCPPAACTEELNGLCSRLLPPCANMVCAGVCAMGAKGE